MLCIDVIYQKVSKAFRLFQIPEAAFYALNRLGGKQSGSRAVNRLPTFACLLRVNILYA